MDPVWTSALGLGFLGSLHCAVMCSPLAVAGCTRGDRTSPLDVAGYILGRTLAYAVVGAVFGTLGHARVLHDALGSIQTVATILVAGIALHQGVRLLLHKRPSPPTLVQLPNKQGGVTRFIAKVLPRRGLGLGMATGFLPCGMLMSAWMLAASSGSAESGALVMAAFAFASFPALLAPVLTRRWLKVLTERLSLTWYGLAWCALAVWIGARPYLSAVHHH